MPGTSRIHLINTFKFPQFFAKVTFLTKKPNLFLKALIKIFLKPMGMNGNGWFVVS